MSNYIASLVDPLFRQARRFSESSWPSPTPNLTNSLPHGVDAVAGNGNGDTVHGETFRRRRGTWAGRATMGSRSRSFSVAADNNDANLSTHLDLTDRLLPHSSSSLDDAEYGNVSAARGISQGGNDTEGQGDPGARRGVTDWEAMQSFPLTSGGLERPSDCILPADDGMSSLRRKIQAIQKLEISAEEKARLVHGVMTERYRSIRSYNGLKSTTANLSAQVQTKDQTWTPASQNKESFERLCLTSASLSANTMSTAPYYLSPSDLEATYVPAHSRNIENQPIPIGPAADSPSDEDEAEPILCLGCEHYRRNVKLQCYTCKRWYTCRFCHDAVESHLLQRRNTEHMLCMICKTAQPAGQWCKSCGIMTASYYCSVCKLWDNDSRKAIYHCNDCGICRRGQGLGKDFIHCKVVNL